MSTNGEPSMPLIRQTTLAERCENGTLRLDDTVDTWGMGRCCLGCGLPVVVNIGHYAQPAGARTMTEDTDGG